MPAAIDSLREAVGRKKLLVVTGAGVSKALTSTPTAPNWPQLILSGIDYCVDRALIKTNQSERWRDTVNSDDIDELLSAAEFVTRKLGSSGSDIYARWLEEAVGHLLLTDSVMAGSIRDIAQSGIPLATLNYDTLLEQATHFSSIGIKDSRQSIQWVNGEITGILHIHGVWSEPSTCILGIRDYHDAVLDERRLLIQRAMATFNSLLFIGCGDTFNDPNFEALIAWMRANVGAGMPNHYALVRESEVKSRLADKGWQGFVEPISFGESYDCLPQFISGIFGSAKPSAQIAKVQAKRVIQAEAPAIIAYRKFLIRDCGQMTIEGIRADMETAKQRFEIEKLFVPLEFDPVAPESLQALSDDSEEKAAWRRSNPSKLPFDQVLRKSKRIALLALPGGGKTMLLKRLAVAYADQNRLIVGNDKLPKIEVLPIVIRCREWKDHIRSPIPVIFERMFEITGDQLLKGFADEVEPFLKKGKVLLLVDGLDEIHDDASRSIFVEHLETFLTTYPKIRMVVTSREAGFDLVAPTIVRFCDRWKIAPLPEASIRLLCSYWHLLMMPRDTEAESEAKSVADVLMAGAALRRLAENPLLLTMLLVVKHGAGRLPPDRVSLYSRATEVLLDTWNIKGHSALNVREAVPQLACLAYELLAQGKQTATVSEMSEILEKAREAIPQIARYARDDAKAFLKRVELRSSLLIETGYRAEGDVSVPIYQFRHLTFQEYLAAVAVTEGHYFSYEKDDNVLSALSGVMLSDEWKEVVPMVAVLARKQAAPLLRELVRQGIEERSRQESEEGIMVWARPPSVSRLTQALIEEAEFPSDILTDTYNLVANFANGCTSSDNWSALARGPYGADIRDMAFNLFMSYGVDHRRTLRNTVALLEAHSQPEEFWEDPTTPSVIVNRLLDGDSLIQARTSLLICGSFWLFRAKSPLATEAVYNAVEQAMPNKHTAEFEAISWAFGFSRYLRNEYSLPPYGLPRRTVLDIIVENYIVQLDKGHSGIASFAVESLATLPRDNWNLTLSTKGKKLVLNKIESALKSNGLAAIEEASLIIAFFAKEQFGDEIVINGLNYLKRAKYNHKIDILAKIYEHYGMSEKMRSPRRRTASSRASGRIGGAKRQAPTL